MTSPIVIAHRGASGYRPEHTIASYELAIEMGANFIEPDLVSTRDGVLVARHENALALLDEDGHLIEETTDVASIPRFAERLTVKVIEGRKLRGWFTEDFTLDELKTLRARERMRNLRSRELDDRFEIPTFDEILELAGAACASSGRPIGVYPETKFPSYFASIGLSLEEPLIAALEKHRFGTDDRPAFIQSFEVGNLRRMSSMTRVPLVQLIATEGAPHDLGRSGDPRMFRDLLTDEGLGMIATYAAAVGPDKRWILPRTDDASSAPVKAVIPRAHSAGLAVHAWTFRAENEFLPRELCRKGERFGDLESELTQFFALGVDGVFCDHPDKAVAARSAWRGIRMT